MRHSFLLGVLGGVFSFSMGILAFFVMVIGQANGAVDMDLTINIVLAFLAGTLGIIGSAIGNKRGGVILVISAMLALIATSLFGIPPFILLLVGGVLAFRERGVPEIASVAHGHTERRSNILYYLAIIATITPIITLGLNELDFYSGLYHQPRARLTISMNSFQVVGSDTWVSMSVPVTITNNSPRKANIMKDWNLTLVFSNSTFQFPNQNCTYGTTVLDSAQETQIVFSYDITNNHSIDTNTLRNMIFTISYIDDQGIQTQQFEAIR
jgi:hypothetical protein